MTRSTIQTRENTEFNGKTYPLAKIEVSSESHPFYTGQHKIMDTAGRVEKFNQKFGDALPARQQPSNTRMVSGFGRQRSRKRAARAALFCQPSWRLAWLRLWRCLRPCLWLCSPPCLWLSACGSLLVALCLWLCLRPCLWRCLRLCFLPCRQPRFCRCFRAVCGLLISPRQQPDAPDAPAKKCPMSRRGTQRSRGRNTPVTGFATALPAVISRDAQRTARLQCRMLKTGHPGRTQRPVMAAPLIQFPHAA